MNKSEKSLVSPGGNKRSHKATMPEGVPQVLKILKILENQPRAGSVCHLLGPVHRRLSGHEPFRNPFTGTTPVTGQLPFVRVRCL